MSWPGNFDRLPKWAQSELTKLECQRDDLQEQVALLKAKGRQDSSDADTFAAFDLDGFVLDDVPLGREPRIRFYTSPPALDDWRTDFIEATLRGGELRLMTNGVQLQFLPGGGVNVATVRFSGDSR